MRGEGEGEEVASRSSTLNEDILKEIWQCYVSGLLYGGGY